uniref:Uncharacterized protein n=1 Tax=Anopheles culicifacies TaxID=139723 RepID=A0A182LXQ5_9DIPT
MFSDGSNVIQIHNISKEGTTDELSGENNLISAQPNNYVTRRTNSRRTKSIRNQNSTINIVSDDPHSIIHLDESSINPKSIAETTYPSESQTVPSDDVIVQATEDAAVSKPRRGTRRLLLKATDSNAITIDSRNALKRKSNSVISPQDTGVSPPKQTPNTQTAVQEVSAEVAFSTTCLEDNEPETDRQNINTGTSIIHLDQSSSATKSIANRADLSQTFSGNDVIVQMPKDVTISTTRRITRRMTMETADCNDNTINSRKGPKRKSDNVIPRKKTDVCPPKEPPNTQTSILQQSEVSSSKALIETNSRKSANSGTSSKTRSLDKLNNNAFKILIVSIKRVALPLTGAELNRFKYEDSTRDSRVSLRPSSRIRWQPTSGIKTERSTFARARTTMAKPKIVITSPIIEVPESPPVSERKPQAHSYLNISKTGNSTSQSDTFKKPHPMTHPPMPQLIELEDEENDDVYEFLSSSQNSDIETNTTIQKPKPTKGQKVSASSMKNRPKGPAAKPKAKPSVKNKPKVTVAKPKGTKPSKQANPFGCSKKSLQKVIKKLGGGPVKQPDMVNYKINMEIPEKLSLVSVADAAPQQFENTELPYEDPTACTEISRISHLPKDRLTARPPSFPITSTPANKLSMVAKLDVSSQQKPASPWRLQDDIILPKTSYIHRTKEMIPSYESFTTEDTNVPVVTSAFVTERRRSPPEVTGPVEPVPANAPASNMPDKPSGETIVSDKDLLEIEQMYMQLKATSEMSQKLIKAMRTSKKNPTTPQQNQTMRLACLKLRKWYDRSMNAFNRSMRIISNIQRTTEQSAIDSPVTCASPLTVEQQRTLDNFNLSTDRFRSMIDQLHSAINDSDIENRPPPQPSPSEGAGLKRNGKGPMTMLNAVTASETPKDVVILPERGANTKRNPLMPLNVVPLPQRDSPLMSPLAKDTTTGPKNIRRELLYNKENDSINKGTENQPPKDIDDIRQSVPELPEASGCSVVEIADQTTHHDDVADHSSKENSTEAIPSTQNCFGFDDGDCASESSTAQVTLPMPLNISHETLQRRLKDTKQLLPKQPFYRTQPKQQHRSSGPTRFPATTVRVFGSPSKRPHTLREFVASTPRPADAPSKNQLAVPSKPSSNAFGAEAPDVSAIEPSTVGQSEHVAQNDDPSVALFDTPDRPQWLNNSAHQRTYTRIPRRKKKNIYLANLGLDDDSEEEANASDGDPQELSSDSDTEEGKGKKNANKRKARRKEPVRVEQTKDFKQFVENFNSMCEQVERYELIIE